MKRLFSMFTKKTHTLAKHDFVSGVHTTPKGTIVTLSNGKKITSKRENVSLVGNTVTFY